jgi:hypothetical protein
VIQIVKPWMSTADIRAGARWVVDITASLADAKIGIVCVTQDNQREPWLLFETGALAKSIENTFVCPYLIHMPKENLVQGPLTLFQAQLADRDGTWAVLSMVNEALGVEALPRERLQRTFDLHWPKLEATLSALPPARAESHRPQEEVLAEILETIRSLARRLPAPSPRNILDRYREAWRPGSQSVFRDLAAQLEARIAAGPERSDISDSANEELVRKAVELFEAEQAAGSGKPENNPSPDKGSPP